MLRLCLEKHGFPRHFVLCVFARQTHIASRKAIYRICRRQIYRVAGGDISSAHRAARYRTPHIFTERIVILEKKQFLEAAKVVNTHGVMGEIKLECRCDSAEILKNIPALFIGGKEYKVTRARVIPGDFVLVKLDGINDLDDALKLKSKLALARREDIPKKDSAHFICDILGLPVIDEKSGEIYGTLDDVQTPAVQELYYVKTPSGGTVMIPNVPEFIKKIDEERGIFISVIDGFFGEVDDEI